MDGILTPWKRPTTLHDLGKIIFAKFAQLDFAQSRLDRTVTQQLLADTKAELERFQLWAANLGLQVVGDRSLDYRIQDQPNVKEYASQLLEELEDDLIELRSLIKGESREFTPDSIDQEEDDIFDPHSSSGASEQQESEAADDDGVIDHVESARALLDDISDIIDRLYRLAAQLRSTAHRAPPSARNFYRDPYKTADGTEHFLTAAERDLARRQSEKQYEGRILEIVLQNRRDELGMPHPGEIDLPELSSHSKVLIRRIAAGNAYRQQQFTFWRQREWDRRDGVNRVDYRMEDGLVSERELKQAHKDQSANQRQRSSSRQRKARFAEVVMSEVPSATWQIPQEAVLLQVDETRSLGSVQTATPTVYEPSGRKVGWPLFPKELKGKKEFICPYCFVTLSAKFRSKSQWRCTAEICASADQKTLSTWEEWIVHEQAHHRMDYICTDHSSTFSNRQEYIDHICEEHEKDKDTLLGPQEIDSRAQMRSAPTECCPLCSFESDSWPDMDKHLAFHLESLALLALPLSTGLEMEDDNMGSNQPEGGANSDRALSLNQISLGQEQSSEDLSRGRQNDLPPGQDITEESLALIEDASMIDVVKSSRNNNGSTTTSVHDSDNESEASSTIPSLGLPEFPLQKSIDSQAAFVAEAFHFQKDSPSTYRPLHEIRYKIECRYPKGTELMKHICRFLRGQQSSSFRPYFQVQDPNGVRRIPFSNSNIESMSNGGPLIRSFLNTCSWPTGHSVLIYLFLSTSDEPNEERSFPIHKSRFLLEKD